MYLLSPSFPRLCTEVRLTAMINRLREHILSLFDDFVSKHDSTESPRSSCYIDHMFLLHLNLVS